MPFDRFMIAPISGGLETDVKPWIIPDDAFSRLNNAYIFRGRIKKRFGSRLMNSSVEQEYAQLYSRLRINLGNTPGPLNLPGNASQLKIGQMFSVGNDRFTVHQLGAGVLTLSTNGSATCTINSTTNPNTVTFTGEPAATAVYYYPANPVMGFITYETADSAADPVFVFDTQFAYQYGTPVSGAFNRVGTALWTGSDSQFFWGTTWGQDTGSRNLFVVNGRYQDQIKYWNGSAWTTINPTISSSGGNTITLESALMTVVFKNRLLMLNTYESLNGAAPTQYTNRVRWAAFGNPLASNAWRSDIPGNGNALDAATMEDIISCCFLKDRLIVYFERSTWELVFTGNQAQPFTWQKLNTELGAESTFSVVPFDKFCVAMGNVGVHSCNGMNVQRIDTKIPDTVWEIHEGTNNTERVFGIRDYYAEQIYWTFPNTDTNEYSSTYPNKILVFNYKTGSWAFNDDSITAFGHYYAQPSSAVTWDSLDVLWDNNEILWDGGTSQTLNEQVIAGNQEGFVFIIDANITVNAPALSITNIAIASSQVKITAINHNCNVSDYVYIEYLNGLTGPFLSLYQITSIVNADNFIVEAPDIYTVLSAGDTYKGGGTIKRLSQIDILTKQFNFYVQDNRNATIQKVDFLVDKTATGAFSVDVFTSTSTQGLLNASLSNGAIQGTGIVETYPYSDVYYPWETYQERLWHPTYLNAEGQAVQLRIYLSDTQMKTFNVVTMPFQLHAFTFYTKPTSDRLQ